MKSTLLYVCAAATIAAAQGTNPLAKALNPDISLIVDTSFVERSIGDAEAAHLELPGIAHGFVGAHGHEGHSHAGYNAASGFNLNYGELAFKSAVDPYFTLDGVFHFSEENVEIEEAYFTTTSLPWGVRLRGGKFFSDFGRHNSMHHHVWNFADAPLVYQAFLGSHGLNEKGIQLQWVAPAPHYLMLGAELLQGENEQMFGLHAIEEGGVMLADDVKAPAMVVGYLKTAFDIGDTTLLTGVSYAQGKSRIDHLEDEEPHAFYGDSRLYGADLTLKYFADSYRYVSWENELLYRDMKGSIYTAESASETTMRKKQTGLVSQLVYAHDRTWRSGLRFDDIVQNDVNGAQMPAGERYSAMVEYVPSEFSRIRVQYNVNRALYEEEEYKELQSVIVQLNFSIGAHGAHAF